MPAAGSARLGSAPLGPARPGPAPLGSPRPGSAPLPSAWPGPAPLRLARLGCAAPRAANGLGRSTCHPRRAQWRRGPGAAPAAANGSPRWLSLMMQQSREDYHM